MNTYSRSQIIPFSFLLIFACVICASDDIELSYLDTKSSSEFLLLDEPALEPDVLKVEVSTRAISPLRSDLLDLSEPNLPGSSLGDLLNLDSSANVDDVPSDIK